MEKILYKIDETLTGLLFSKLNWPLEFYRKADGYDSLIDLGCGPDSERKNLKHIRRSLGVDIFEPSLARSIKDKIHQDHLLYDVCKIDKAPGIAPKSFDIAISIDNIEHLTKEQGLKLISDMESIARKRVIIFTPNGFIDQGAKEENEYQTHHSGWTASEMKKLGFKVIGINGWKPLRRDGTQMRFRPRYFWEIVSGFTQVAFARWFPSSAYQILCIKDLK